MTTEAKHKPCPFCGQEDDWLNLECVTHPAGSRMAAIECYACGMLGPIVYKEKNIMDEWTIGRVTEESAWAAWDAWQNRAEVNDGSETRT